MHESDVESDMDIEEQSKFYGEMKKKLQKTENEDKKLARERLTNKRIKKKKFLKEMRGETVEDNDEE